MYALAIAHSFKYHLLLGFFLSIPVFLSVICFISVLQFQHFNISSHISRAEAFVLELFSRTGNLGEKSLMHQRTQTQH